MTNATRPGTRLLAVLVVLLTIGLAGPTGPAQARPPVRSPQVACGTATSPCLGATDIHCWEYDWCQVPVTVSPYAGLALTIHYATGNGTALAGQNYLPAQGTLAIPAGATGATVPVYLTSRTISGSGPAYLYLTLSSPSHGLIVSGTATVTIVPRPA